METTREMRTNSGFSPRSPDCRSYFLERKIIFFTTLCIDIFLIDDYTIRRAW